MILGIKILKFIEIIPNYIVNDRVTFTLVFANLSRKIIIEEALITVAKLELYDFLLSISWKPLQKESGIIRYAQRSILIISFIFDLAKILLAKLAKL
jgi:hypothetical protein